MSLNGSVIQLPFRLIPKYIRHSTPYIKSDTLRFTINMKHLVLPFVIIFTLLLADFAEAQTRTVPQSQQFRLAEGMVRIAEPGQLADTVSVQGDINAPGRFIIPRGTTAPQLIAYARGPISVRTGETILDWSKLRLEFTISSYDRKTGESSVQHFRFHYNEMYPDDLRNYVIRNEDIINVEIKRKPAFVDYVRVVAPVVSIVATTILIIDRL